MASSKGTLANYLYDRMPAGYISQVSVCSKSGEYIVSVIQTRNDIMSCFRMPQDEDIESQFENGIRLVRAAVEQIKKFIKASEGKRLTFIKDSTIYSYENGKTSSISIKTSKMGQMWKYVNGPEWEPEELKEEESEKLNRLGLF